MSEKELEERMRLIARHREAQEQMQSGIAFLEQPKWEQGGIPPVFAKQLKHLRVGINTALADHGALVVLLVEKGVITDGEYLTACANAMEAEVARLEQALKKEYGGTTTITLGRAGSVGL